LFWFTELTRGVISFRVSKGKGDEGRPEERTP